MGGLGSGRSGPRRGRKRAVEDCLTLDIGAWREAGLLASGSSIEGRWAWPPHPGKRSASFDYRNMVADGGEGAAWLR